MEERWSSSAPWGGRMPVEPRKSPKVIGMFRKSEDGGMNPHLTHQKQKNLSDTSGCAEGKLCSSPVPLGKTPTVMLTQHSRVKLQQRKDRR